MIRNCLARIGCLALIVLLVAGAWWFRHDLTRWWNRLEITSVSEPSEDLARRAEREVEEFVASDGRDGLTLTQAEIQSLLTFRAQELLPDGISETQIEMRDSTLLLSARVDPFGIEGLASPELLERFLSDSARVVVELAPGVLQPGVASVRVMTLQAGSLVVPSMMVPWILGGLEIPGVEATGSTLLVPLPAVVRRFEVSDGRLRLRMGPE